MQYENLFFRGWTGLFRTAVVGVCAYATLWTLDERFKNIGDVEYIGKKPEK